jgi:hypothetical protein
VPHTLKRHANIVEDVKATPVTTPFRAPLRSGQPCAIVNAMGTINSQDDDPTAHTNLYQYEPLPPGDFFRYLVLGPGSGGEPLRCSLHTAAIADKEYEAISYVWGSGVKDQHISCDGCPMNITTNLYNALRRLRDSTKVRHLWADSICIDQDNLEEKGHQVANMSGIYSSASQVLIYMGLDPHGHGPKVASLLSDVDDFLRREIAKLNSLDWEAFPDSNELADHPLLRDERWRSLRVLLDLQWFERGWVVREAGLARHGLVVLGDSDIPWQTLMWAVTWIRGRVDSLPALPNGYVYRRLGSHFDAHVDRYISRLRIFFRAREWARSTLLTHFAQGRDHSNSKTDATASTPSSILFQPQYQDFR